MGLSISGLALVFQRFLLSHGLSPSASRLSLKTVWGDPCRSLDAGAESPVDPVDQEREGRILELGSEVAQAREGGGSEVARVLAGGALQRRLLTQRVVVCWTGQARRIASGGV